MVRPQSLGEHDETSQLRLVQPVDSTAPQAAVHLIAELR